MSASRVLVSDFDGTMTRHDFYQLAIQSLLPSNTPDHWADYRAGSPIDSLLEARLLYGAFEPGRRT